MFRIDRVACTLVVMVGLLALAGAQRFFSSLQSPDGSAAAPTYSFASDTDSGLYRHGANDVALSAGGTRKVTAQGSGDAVLVNGTIQATGIGLGTSGATNQIVGASDIVLSPSTGRVGIGATPAPYNAVRIARTVTNGDLFALETFATTSATSSGSRFVQGVVGDVSATNVSSGVSDGGYRIGVVGHGYVNAASGFAGTLATNRGVWGRAGINAAMSGAAVTSAAAIYGEVLNAVSGTTITNAYGLLIENAATTGTITNRWGVYVDGGGLEKNYLSGKVGIGESSPTARLHPAASTTSAASLRLPAGSAPTSPNEGDVWQDSTQKAFVGYAAGVKSVLVGVIFAGTADKTVSGDQAETTLMPTGVGTLTLPANALVAGKTVRVRMHGQVGNTAAATVKLRFKIGSTAVALTGVHTVGGQNATVANWQLDAVMTCRGTGASASVRAQGHFATANTTGGGVTHAALHGGTSTTIDTTASQAIDVTAEWAEGDTNSILRTTNATVELLN